MEGEYIFKRFRMPFPEAVDGDGDVSEDGEVRAKVASLGVKDNENHLIVKGEVGRHDVIVSEWNHNALIGQVQPPVGKGVVYEDGDDLIAEIEYFLELEHAKNAFTRVKKLGSMAEWSIGFKADRLEFVRDPETPDDPLEAVYITHLYGVGVREVSPVGVGAGVDTRTLAVKNMGRPDMVKAASLENRYRSLKTRENFLRSLRNDS